MKNYNYKKELMFYIYENSSTENICKTIMKDFVKYSRITNLKVNCKSVEKEYIQINLITDDNIVNMIFNYNESLFYNCYKFNGIYQSKEYRGSRVLITKIISFIKNNYLIVNKKEPLYCKECNEQIGWTFNDLGNNYKSFCACGGKNQDQKWMYDYCEIIQCDGCGDYFCWNCESLREFDLGFTCDDCQEKEFEKFKEDKCDGDCNNCFYDWKCNYEEYMLDEWATCKFEIDDEKYENCGNCKCKDECLSDAEDSRDGYAMFEDSIVGCGYDSMEEFWEHHI